MVTSQSGHMIWFVSVFPTDWLSAPFQTWLTPPSASPQRVICAGCIIINSISAFAMIGMMNFAFRRDRLFLAEDYIWINQVIVIVRHIILQLLTLQNVWTWTAWSAGEGGTAVQRFKPNIFQAAIKETSLLSPSVQGEEKLNVMCVSAAPPPSQLSNFMLQFFLLN